MELCTRGKRHSFDEPQGLLQPPLPATMKQPLSTDPMHVDALSQKLIDASSSNGCLDGSITMKSANFALQANASAERQSFLCVTSLSLRSQKLTDETLMSVDCLASVLHYFPCLTHLDVSNNNFSAAGARLLALDLNNTTSGLSRLRHLAITGNPLGADGVTAIGQAASRNAWLERLEIGDRFPTGEISTAAVSSIVALVNNSVGMKSLTVVGPLAWMDVAGFDTIVAALLTSRSVTEMNLHDCVTEDKSAGTAQERMFASLDKVLSEPLCPLRKLALRCTLNISGATKLCDAVGRAARLESLCLARCLSGELLKQIGKMLSANRTLQCLDVSFPTDARHGSLGPIAAALARENRTLRELHLAGIPVLPEELEELGKGIAKLGNTSLCALNPFPRLGGEKLRGLLTSNLSRCGYLPITVPGVGDLTLQAHKSIAQVHIDSPRSGGGGDGRKPILRNQERAKPSGVSPKLEVPCALDDGN